MRQLIAYSIKQDEHMMADNFCAAFKVTQHCLNQFRKTSLIRKGVGEKTKLLLVG